MIKPRRQQIAPGAARPRRWNLLWIPGLVVVAIVPWLVPWHSLTGGVATPPAAPVIVTPESSAPPPDQKSVADVRSAIQRADGHDLPVSPEEAAKVATEPGPYRTVGRVQIPSVGLDVTYGEGVDEDTLRKGPGHWPGTPLPGRSGNAVISGHRNTHTQPFKELDRIKPGDKIVVSVGKGAPVTYIVDDTTIVPQEEYKTFVLTQPKDAKVRQVTLFACHPEGNPIYRIVVRATAAK